MEGEVESCILLLFKLMLFLEGQWENERASTMWMMSHRLLQSSACEWTCMRSFSMREKHSRVDITVKPRSVVTSGQWWVWRISGCLDEHGICLSLDEV